MRYSSSSQVTFGVKSGMNIATTKGLIAYPKNRIGWYAGGVMLIPIQKKFFFQPELLFSAKGCRARDLSDGSMDAIRLDYINAPILFGYQIDLKTSIVIGTELGYLIKATSHSGNAIAGKNFDITNRFPHKFDISIATGIAYDITKVIGAEVRYNFGLNGFYMSDAVGARPVEYKAANRVFQLGLYYNIH
jgi:hypothetical protein